MDSVGNAYDSAGVKIWCKSNCVGICANAASYANSLLVFWDTFYTNISIESWIMTQYSCSYPALTWPIHTWNTSVIKLLHNMATRTLERSQRAGIYRWPCRLWLPGRLGNPPRTGICSCLSCWCRSGCRCPGWHTHQYLIQRRRPHFKWNTHDSSMICRMLSHCVHKNYEICLYLNSTVRDMEKFVPE